MFKTVAELLFNNMKIMEILDALLYHTMAKLYRSNFRIITGVGPVTVKYHVL